MDRRNFLKLAAVGAASIARPDRTFGYNALRHPLMSTADYGTKLDETRAAKARKLAEYVITRDKQPGLLSYDPNSDIHGLIRIGDSQVVQAVMVVNGQRYTIIVINGNEKARIKPTDSMYIWARPEGTKGEDTLIKLDDGGLGGRCNRAFIPAKLSGIGKKIDYNNWFGPALGVEHEERVQALYTKTLDTLIKFYERPKVK